MFAFQMLTQYRFPQAMHLDLFPLSVPNNFLVPSKRVFAFAHFFLPSIQNGSLLWWIIVFFHFKKEQFVQSLLGLGSDLLRQPEQ